jgi:DNA ligase-1
MELDGNKYRTISGLVDGEKVVTEWTVVNGKQNTTPEEQASKEVAAKYKKQLKTGYFENIHDVDNITYVEPMLAKSYKDCKVDIASRNWLMQCKFNGVRCIATKNGLFSRKGEMYVSTPHINESLSGFFLEHPHAILDGELFNEEFRQNLNEINSLVRKTKHISRDDLEKSRQLISFYVYDGYDMDGVSKDDGYIVRKNWIDSNVTMDYTKPVNDIHLLSENHMWECYNLLVESGHEGAILRNKNSPYENKRSKHLLKLKPEDDSEGIILNIKEGSGNWSGTGKIITLMWEGKEFDATFKGSLEEGVKFFEEKQKWIGQTVTFLYNGLTGLGVPNYARVDINNCLKGH